jgi:PIN domain nuclease of toxin-antitoxin system
LAIKHHGGKLPQAQPLLQNWDALLTKLVATRLDITPDHAITAGGLAWDHKDPFDRLLAAQAMWCQARLISRDEVFASAGVLDQPALW